MATWVVVPNLDDLRDQLNEIAPDRDKSSDGSIGDTSHAAGRSSHNPDKTGNPEHRDGDAQNEVRARDFDKDLRRPGLTMAMVVHHLVLGARSGRFWWLRYIIFDGVIYHKSNGFQARTYAGQNKHREHAHVNSDFTQAADAVRNVNYHLEELVTLTPAEIDKIAAATAARIFDERIPDYEKPAANRPSNSFKTWIGHLDFQHNETQKAVIEALRAELAPIRAALAAMEDAIDGLQAAPPVSTETLVNGLRTVIREGVGE